MTAKNISASESVGRMPEKKPIPAESPRIKELKELAAISPRYAMQENVEVLDRAERAENNQVTEAFDETLNIRTGEDGESRGVDRKDTAENALEAVVQYRSGYEKLNDEIKGYIREKILSAIQGEPLAKAFLDREIASGTLNEALDEIANDPKYRQEVIARRKDLLREKPEFGAKQTAEGEMNETKKTLDLQIKDIDKKINEFSSGTVKVVDGNVHVVPGEKWKDIMDAQEIMNNGKAEYDAKTDELNKSLLAAGLTEDQLSDAILAATRIGDQDRLDQLIKISNMKKDIMNSSYQTAKTMYDELDEEYSLLTKQRLTLTHERLGIDMEDAIENFSGKSSGQVERAERELEYAEKLNNIFRDALVDTITLGEVVSDEEANAEIKIEAEHESDPVKKALLDSMGEYGYWGGAKVGKGGSIENITNKKHIKEHIDILTSTSNKEIAAAFAGKIQKPGTQGGVLRDFYTEKELLRELSTPGFSESHLGGTQPESIMRLLIMSRLNPRTGRNYTLSEVNSAIAQNPKEYEDMPDKVALNVVKKAVLTKQLNTSDLEAIVNDPTWGGEHFMHSVLSDNAVKEKIAQYEKGGLKLDLDWRKDKKNWLVLLGIFLLGGAPGAFIYAGVKSIRRKGGEASSGGHH